MRSGDGSPSFSQFLSPPAEIRIKVYDLLLISSYAPDNGIDFAGPTINVSYHEESTKPTSIHLTSPASHIDWTKQFAPASVSTSILATCKQVASEATSTLYTRNAMSFGGADIMVDWLNVIGLPNSQTVRNLVCYPQLPKAMNELEAVFERCTGLRRFEIYSHLTAYFLSDRKRIGCDFLAMVQPWLKSHQSLTKAMSKYPGGYQHEPRNIVYPQYLDAIFITFVTDEDDGQPLDGTVFDPQAAIKIYKDRSH